MMPLLIYVWYNFTNPLICTSALNYNWCAESDTSFRGFDLLSEKELLKRTLILSWKRQFRIYFDYDYSKVVSIFFPSVPFKQCNFWCKNSILAKEVSQRNPPENVSLWWLSSKVYLWVVRTSTSGYYYDVNGCQICWYVNIRERVCLEVKVWVHFLFIANLSLTVW